MSDDKLDINDPGFLSDDNLNQIGEPDENDWFTGGVADSGGGESADAVVDGDVGGGAGESADGVGGVDDSGQDERSVEDSGVDDSESDPAPQLKDLSTAKKSYADLRAWANLTKQELDQVKSELESLRNSQLASDDDFYDEDQFQYLAENAHPAEAFQYALENNSPQDALQAIARVQADAADIAAQVAIARQEGDEQTAANLSAAAANASALAEHLRNQLFLAQQEQQLAPTRQREMMNDMAAASARVRAKHPDAVQLADSIGRIVNDFPQILGDGSPMAIEAGMERALFMARGQASAQQGVNIDELVAQKVAEALGESRKVKRSSASAAMGEDSGRASSANQKRSSEEDLVREAMGLGDKGGAIGFKGFWNLNNS
jgi:hypothetical protein